MTNKNNPKGGAIIGAIQSANFNPDLVLLNLYLKHGFNGWDVLLDIKTQNPDLPVFMVTAHDKCLYDPRLSKADGYIIDGSFAPEDMKIGDKIRPTIDQSIRVHDKLLIVLSEYSVNSQWVEQEVETALARERNQDQLVLFPVRLDNTVMEIDSGWPALIKNIRHIGDFSRWKDHDAYQQAFEHLLRDLKAEG